MLHKHYRRIRIGFTLIELMVVILIIAILVGAVVAIGSQVKAAAARRSTLATLKVLDGMMQEYLAMGNREPQPPNLNPNPAGNPPDLVGWPYGSPGTTGYNNQYHGNPPPPPAYLPTAFLADPAGTKVVSSDPVNWVIAFRAIPELNKKLNSLPLGHDIAVNWGSSLPSGVDRYPVVYVTDVNGNYTTTPPTIVYPYPPLPAGSNTVYGGTNLVVLDAWGNPIRYVPSVINSGGAAVPSSSGNLPGYFISAGPDGMFVNSYDTGGASTVLFQNGFGQHPKHDDIYSTDPQ